MMFALIVVIVSAGGVTYAVHVGSHASREACQTYADDALKRFWDTATDEHFLPCPEGQHCYSASIGGTREGESTKPESVGYLCLPLSTGDPAP